VQKERTQKASPGKRGGIRSAKNIVQERTVAVKKRGGDESSTKFRRRLRAKSVGEKSCLAIVSLSLWGKGIYGTSLSHHVGQGRTGVPTRKPNRSTRAYKRDLKKGGRS